MSKEGVCQSKACGAAPSLEMLLFLFVLQLPKNPNNPLGESKVSESWNKPLEADTDLCQEVGVEMDL